MRGLLIFLFVLMFVGCEKSPPAPAPKPSPVSNWKQGPMPEGAWNWGGVVPKGEESTGGFYFADFRGDYVLLCPTQRRVDAKDIAYYNNALDLPPHAPGKVKAGRLE